LLPFARDRIVVLRVKDELSTVSVKRRKIAGIEKLEDVPELAPRNAQPCRQVLRGWPERGEIRPAWMIRRWITYLEEPRLLAADRVPAVFVGVVVHAAMIPLAFAVARKPCKRGDSVRIALGEPCKNGGAVRAIAEKPYRRGDFVWAIAEKPYKSGDFV